MTSYPPYDGQINTTAVADGTSTTNSTSTTTPWSCETNWTVTRGSLNSSVTFESFDFPIDSESTAPKPPLLLLPPPTSDFEPCEIKLNFTQKHEIRQVYVKSTARVYEIYYAPNLHSENEYLCTVRCCAASVEENLFPESDVNNAISVNLEDSNATLPKGRVASENTISTNEDDWVEIKLPVVRVDEGNNHSPNTSRNHQNYYEATAEINDSDPCTSLTLRLLSLQNKACVHIDEVYVFADCIATDDSQNQTVNPETSAGTSSLMTMLVPTLLGLSKSRSLQSHDQHFSKSVEKPSRTESQPAAESTRCQTPPSTSDNDKLCDSTSRNGFSDGLGIRDSESGPTPELTKCHGLPLTSDKDKGPISQFSFNHKDQARNKRIPQGPKFVTFFKEPNTPLLEQLVSRVSRIEDILLRFEENMLKPLNSIEARLHHVEQQVQSLAKNSPSNSNQLSADSESEYQQDTSVPISTQSPPSEEKHETNDVFHPQKVSIDDALAAALAGFSSFTKPDNSFPVLPLESPQEQCLTLTSNNETSVSCEPLKETVITEDSFGSQGITEMVDENSKIEADIVEEELTETVKILTFDKNDIMKYFPDGDGDSEVKDVSEAGVDFETDILEVKFASLENSDSLESHLEEFLSFTNGERVLVNPECVEEVTVTGKGLLVELDGDDDVAESVQEDLTLGHLEMSFDSLI